MSSTTDRGNAFREKVGDLLRAAGFRAETETRIGYKNVDVRALYSKDELSGPLLYAFEAKDHEGTLALSECTQFVNDHQPLIRNGEIDHAWLISKGPFSPSGRQAIETADRKMRAMTYAELQRRLLLLDPYLTALVDAHEASRLADYYIRPETSEHEDLETLVRGWIEEEHAAPLFVLGPYGKGKSTFANHLAAQMAKEALADATARVPILIRLGEIADEQSIDGLVGKVLASHYRVHNYHFETFSALNREGRFLLIYDGFDEMKHGMTPAKFQQALAELMRLDEGKARILVLGRDTAFHDEVEFRSVMDGVQRTSAGRVVRTPGRKAYRHVELRGFTLDEACDYVRRYLPVRASQEVDGPATDGAWVSRRADELVDGQFDGLLVRPVHAQMLCEIAIQPENLRPEMSVYELFDSFVHYLLHRETGKKGRDAAFSIEVRRRFNASLAWWLWERGGASTTTLADIPQSLCEEATKDIVHSLGREELRRELIQGCLIEKGPNTIYFHRSIQEFLVAEHLIETDLLQRSASTQNWFQSVTKGTTPEVTEFIVAGVQVSQQRRDAALRWLGALASARGDLIPVAGFALFPDIGHAVLAEVRNPTDSPWLMWLTFFLRSGGRDFAARKLNTFAVLADLLIAARASSNEAQAAALYAVARTLFHPTPRQSGSLAIALAAMLPIKRLRLATEQAQVKKSERQIILHDDDFMLWAVLRTWRVERDKYGSLQLVVNLSDLHHDALSHFTGGFDRDTGEPQPSVTVTVQSIYQALAAQNPPASEKDLEAIRPFFNDDDLRNRLSPVEISRRTRASEAPVIAKRERPILRMDSRTGRATSPK